MKIALLFLTSLITFFSTIAQTEKMSFKNLTPDMGLSDGDVLCLYQDHEGYMWIGTVDGLNKYDGEAFTVYRYNQKDTTSLSSSRITCIYEDKKYNLWIGLINGLCRYNRDKNSFERISYADDQNKKFRNTVNTVLEDNTGKLWIGTNNGIFWFDFKNRIFHTCFTNMYGKDILINFTEIHQDKNGILWFTSSDQVNGGIIKYNPVTKETNRYNTQHPVIKLKENAVNSLIIDKQENIWTGAHSTGLSMINQRTKTITNYQKELNNGRSLNNNFIASMVQNIDGKIFIGSSGGGLNVFDPATKIFNHYTKTEYEGSIVSNNITSIYIGHDGIIWIGCWGGGVSMYDKRFEKFTHYKHEKQLANSLNGAPVTNFTEDLNGNIWIAADGGGITFFNPKEKTFIRHLSDINNPQTLTNNKVLAVETDTKGGLWAGMWGGGLNYFQINGSKLILKKKYSNIDETDPKSSSIFRIYQNNAGELWVVNYGTGAYLFDPKTDRFKFMISIKDSKGNPRSNAAIIDVLSDYQGDVWLARLDSGLIRLNRKSGKCEKFIHNEKDSASISSNAINVVFEDSKKRLWVGSSGGGLNLFNRQTNMFTHYATNQGLPDNSIIGILEDNRHNLWISSHNGISKATIVSTKEKLELTFRNYSTLDGLQNKIFNNWAYFKSRSGEMYFGGINGFNVFHPDSIKDNSFIPPVHITDFLLFNKPVIIGAKGSPLKKHISQTQELVLNYDQSVFTFRFVALNYIFSEKNQYAYTMEGFDKDWNYVGNKQEATYTNLAPGEYTFQVKASNNDRVWNEEGASIKISILPPWWRAWWFKSVILLILISSVYMALYLRVALYRKKQKELSILVKQRTHEISQANDVLLERQTRIEEYAEELRVNTENLSEANELLLDKQKLIETQALQLQEANEQLQDTNEQLKDTNEQLSVLNSTKDRFFSIIAHDLRNPFHTVSGFAEILMKDYKQLSPEKIQKFHDLIYTSSTNGKNLLESLLEWSRSQTGRITYNPTKLNIYTLSEEVVNLLQGDAYKKNITIRQLIDPAITVFADENMLKTIIRNLLSNAIKFSHEQGNISLKSTIVDQQVEITVADAGVGIPAENLPLLFRIDATVTTKGTAHESGTGLGLILCKEFVEKNNGKIWVESEEEKGSEFKFILPLG